MEGRNAETPLLNPKPTTIKKSKRLLLTNRSIQHSQPDIFFFYRNFAKKMFGSLKEFYYSTSATFLLDQISFASFKKICSPLIYASVAYFVGNKATKTMSEWTTESEDYDFVLKSIIGLSILAYSITHRITDKEIKSTPAYRRAMASEILAIAYLYTSSFKGSQLLLKGHVDDNTSLVASLLNSAMITPAALTYITKKYQDLSLYWLYQNGAQRSDSTAIFSGKTTVVNGYLQINHFLIPEILTKSRLFQIALIARNVITGGRYSSDKKIILKKFKNLPLFLMDILRPAIRKIIEERVNLENDRKNNTAIHHVLEFNAKKGSSLSFKPRHQLRSGDLVFCNEAFDVNSSPIAGEIVAFQKDEKSHFTPMLAEEKYEICLERNNGESNWLKFKTHTEFDKAKKIDLLNVRNRKQNGILVGSQVDFKNKYNFFIKVKPESHRIVASREQKKSVSEQIIEEHKNRAINFAIICSLVTALISSYDHPYHIPALSLDLLLDLYQTYIPFSEGVLRETVNNKLLKELNVNLDDFSTEELKDFTLKSDDAMRIVDVCNAVSGYYQDKFPKGSAVVTDKTGTLTTHIMHTLGVWTVDMPANVQSVLNEKKSSVLMPDQSSLLACYELFACAFSNSKKEIEPEEFSVLTFFQKIFLNKDCLQVEVIGNNYFKKTINLADKTKIVETYHVSDLFRSLGGRCTLVDEGEDKFLIFCGIPKADRFHDKKLLTAYLSMRSRIGVLSRDWCIARVRISNEKFRALKELFTTDNQIEAEKLICESKEIIAGLEHYGTFIIDNPVKKAAERFISNFSKLNIPVFIATGDTAKAAENIARVLCGEQTRQIITLRGDAKKAEAKFERPLYTQDMTVIFVNINSQILILLDELLEKPFNERPAIIFSEMTASGKGELAKFLNKKGYFTICNGDGTNDISMMENSHAVFAHLTDKGGYARKVEKYANLNDVQLQKISDSSQSFYELFDLHESKSKFHNSFARMVNSQEKPSIALLLKSAKLGFEFANVLRFTNVIEMPYQHWAGILFDSIWVSSSYFLINHFADYPLDKDHLGRSSIPLACAILSLATALTTSFYNYFNKQESTNPATMLLLYTLFMAVFPAICSRFGREEVQYIEVEASVAKNIDVEIITSKKGFFSACRHKSHKNIEPDLSLEIKNTKTVSF